jgi:hypothetical protein
MSPNWKIDWSETPETSLRELLRQGEVYLDGTIQLGIASDQRAGALTTIFGGGATALLAAAAAVFSGSHSSIAFEWAAAVTAAFLFIGSFQAARAAQPVNFHVAGYEPKLLQGSSSDEIWMLRYVVLDIQTRIDLNRAALDRAARLTTWALRLAAFGVLAGLATFGVLTLVARCPS